MVQNSAPEYYRKILHIHYSVSSPQLNWTDSYRLVQEFTLLSINSGVMISCVIHQRVTSGISELDVVWLNRCMSTCWVNLNRGA